MSFLRRLLEKSRLVVLQAPTPPPPPATPAPTSALPLERRQVRLAELLREERERRVREAQARIEAGLGLKADPAQVFKVAGVNDPAHGWSVDAVVRFLDKPELRDKEPAERQRLLLTDIAIKQVPPEDVIADARRRDEALDAYGRFVEKNVAGAAGELDKQIEELSQRIAELQAERAAIAEKKAGLLDARRTWRRQKRALEEAWTAALRYLTTEVVVSVDEPPKE